MKLTCIALILLMHSFYSYSQVGATIVEGQIIDAAFNEPLSFANISFTGTSLGTTTDLDGFFTLESNLPVDSIEASYVGYQSKIIAIRKGEKQVLNFSLVPISHSLNTVTVVAEKEKYRKKGNPAVALIRKVIENKDQNSLEAFDSYQYEKYEKIQLDVSNLTPKFIENRALRGVSFVFDYMDTTENGVPFLPFFLQESQSTIYYTQKPKREKEHRKALKLTNLEEYTSGNSIANLTKRLYQEIDIYNPNIVLFNQQFVSPLSTIAPSFYRFYIIDTIDFKGERAINLAFLPANKFSLGFNGNLYIKQDTSYKVLGVEMSLLEDINLNFVNALHIKQDFALIEDTWVVVEEDIIADFKIAERFIGIIGRKSSKFYDHRVNQDGDPKILGTPGKLISDEGELNRMDGYWEAKRPYPLSEREKTIYWMIDTLQEVPSFRAALNFVKVLTTGYFTVGSFDFGSVFNFLSFNDIEGFRLKVGGYTNSRFHDRIRLGGHLAYGFNDDIFKYSGEVRYALDNKPKQIPLHYLRMRYEFDNIFPGQFISFASPDNLFLSFRTGIADKMLSNERYQIEYFREFPNNFSYLFNFERLDQRGLGRLDLTHNLHQGEDQVDQSNTVSTFSAGIQLTYAPNATYWEGQQSRIPIPNNFPIFRLEYKMGVDGFLDSEFQYYNLNLGIEKRFRLSVLGYSDIRLEGGKIWGENLPYILLDVPRANQTLVFQFESFNLMNFQEFVSDEYVQIDWTHYFNGFFVNRIPLLRQWKLREIFSVKAYFGSLSDQNNPLHNPGLVQFVETENGELESRPLGSTPYIEASFGVENILKFFRLGLVKRLTYLNEPNIPSMFGMKGIGLRVGAAFKF